MIRAVWGCGTFLAAAAVVALLGQTSPPPRSAREDAYRANNRGVASLEQFDFEGAASDFREALRIDADLSIARFNLAVALFYGGDLDAARREATAAGERLANAPQPPYLLGLIARAQNRADDAAAAFRRVLQVDATDVGSKVNLGQVDLQQQKYAEAIALFRDALAAEPYNVTAAYNLAMALTRSGAADEGARAMQRFQALRGSGYATTYAQTYLEQGKYAEAIASTGAEADLVDPKTPDVAFEDATPQMLPGPRDQAGGGIVLADLNGDGRLDLIEAGPGVLRVEIDSDGVFADGSTAAGVTGFAARTNAGVVAGDYDNDGRPDLLLLRTDGIVLLHQRADGKFEDATTASKLPRLARGAGTAAFVDVDHDGDLDIVLAPPAQVFRNDGNGTFAAITPETRITGADRAVAIVPTDFDNRRDVDLLFADEAARPALFRNMRDGTFREVAAEVGLPPGASTSVAAADVNKDGYTDFFFGSSSAPGTFALSDGHARFHTAAAPETTRGATAAQFFDYDNDGLLDLLTVSAGGVHLFRNIGTAWVDVSGASGVARFAAGSSVRSIALGDVDRDGDTDVIVERTDGQVRGWRNRGGNRHPSLTVTLAGRVSNREGIGSRVEMRAGSLRQQLETASAFPAVAPADLVFGLGDRAAADVVRVLWPSGVLQAETAPPAGTHTLAVTELNRKPSSCPFLYTWNGSRFEFVTDFMGGGEMGDYVSPGVWNQPDPDEYVRIRPGQLAERNGRYELRMANELEEAMFVDRLQLVAVDHPEDVDVYPNEGLKSPPRPPFQIYAVRNARPPAAASEVPGTFGTTLSASNVPKVPGTFGMAGARDVLSEIRALDRTYPDGFALAGIRGYAALHDLVLDLSQSPKPTAQSLSPDVLLLTGWTDYAYSSDNVAAEQAGLTMTPPYVQVRNAAGAWQTVIPDMGFPVGRPQTVVVDLRGKFLGPSRRVRIRTSMRIYWDQVLVADAVQAPVRISRLDPAVADLHWRGFSAETTPDGREPIGYDYARVSRVNPWKAFTGRYTREGDVRALLKKTDDMFVVSEAGDEIALSFDAARFPALPSGWTRTFLLYVNGYSKEMNIRSASPDQLAPLPFHAMTRYPYGTGEHYPDSPAYQEYLRRYNTRVVERAVPSIDVLLAARK
ncbi:MAG TPA: FG-GAP-like repeat-containing protein [Vicinamibacterales bacterium]|nr:FG-GAP-like repeat-containing protein [Vicinamibacterales bacterium]